MVEDIEKRTLCALFRHKLVNIVDYQHIEALIEIQEIVLVVVSYGVGVLEFKKICRYVKYSFVWKTAFYFETYCVAYVCFTHS